MCLSKSGSKFPTYFSRGMLPSLKRNLAKGIACHDYLRVVLRQVKMPVFGASKMRVTGGVL